MNFNKSKKISLVISDVDGTLINEDKKLTAKTIAAVRQLQQANIRFTIVSARPPFGLNEIVGTLDLQHPFGACNGGLLLEPNGDIIDSIALPQEIVPQIIDLIEEYDLDPWLISDLHWYVKNLQGFHVKHHSETLQFEATSIDSLEAVEEEIIKIVGASDDYDAVEKCEKATQKQFKAKLSATRSQPYYLDITHPDANKGTIVNRLSAYFNIPASEIATIGDNYNDICMFERSEISIAMGNADREVRQKATYVTESNQNDGFALASQKFILDNSSSKVTDDI